MFVFNLLNWTVRGNLLLKTMELKIFNDNKWMEWNDT